MCGGIVGLDGSAWLWMSHFLECLSHGHSCFGVDESAPNSASAADDITAFIICEIFNTAPLLMGISSEPAMNMWPPALLRAFGSER